VRPEEIGVNGDAGHAATVLDSAYVGATHELSVCVAAVDLVVRSPRKPVFAPGESRRVSLPVDAMTVWPAAQ
jgi:hypothetical protein